MDIFQQSIINQNDLINQSDSINQNDLIDSTEEIKNDKKFNELEEAQDIKKIISNFDISNDSDVSKTKNNTKINNSDKFDYSKLNIKSLQISCNKIFNLQNKPFQPFINYIKKFSDEVIFLSNNYFNDLFYIKNNLLYLPVENSFIIAFIEINFHNELNKFKINYFCLDFFCDAKIPRKSINYINKKDYLKEPLDIKNCFLCPYFDFKNQKCFL